MERVAPYVHHQVPELTHIADLEADVYTRANPNTNSNPNRDVYASAFSSISIVVRYSVSARNN